MKIIELKASTKVKGRFLVKLDEGTILRVSEQEILSFNLYEGKEISIEEAEELEHSGSTSALKTKAYDLISRKPLSRHDLEKKLQQWEASPEEIEEICDRFQELALLNDEEYAKMLARHYHRKGYGEKKITQEFFHHGIDREFWEEALCTLSPNDQAIDKFLSQKAKGNHLEEKEVKRLSQALARRGFSWSEIREGLQRYDENLEIEPE
ncbi:MAG: regulatory protein RecX [Eubacteriales bacterium]